MSIILGETEGIPEVPPKVGVKNAGAWEQKTQTKNVSCSELGDENASCSELRGSQPPGVDPPICSGSSQVRAS